MSILTITKSALQQLRFIHKNQKKPYIFFGIKSGGCSGFDYFLKAIDKSPGKLNEIYIEQDVHISICNKSLMYLIGTKIDYTDDIMGSRFIFTNPNADSTCGCGVSFTPI